MIKPPRNLDPDRPDTKNVERLRKRMLEVKTRAQFEGILLDGPEDRRHAYRKLMEPMLREGLPCCGRALRAEREGRPPEHTPLCPTNNRVTLH